MAESKLSLMKPSSPTTPTKKKGGTICNLETTPKPEWVVRGKDERGRTVWYARIEITGLLPRRYGPFKSRAQAILFLDDAVRHFPEPLDCQVRDDARRYVAQPSFRYRDFLPFVEDELGGQYRQVKE